MKLQGLAVLAAGLLLCSCASDGGSSGTGITTAEGNVVSVLRAAAAMSPAPRDVRLDEALGGIRVSVEGTDIAGETDSSGAFRVRGDYDSEVTLLFARAQDGLAARLAVNVPAGGTLTLVDVALDAASGTAQPQHQGVDFDGTIVAVDCAAGELQLVSQQRPDDGDHYVVLLASSTVVDAMGADVPCARLTPGEDAHVVGAVEPDGSFGDARVVLE
jgi:hypothetical protein